MSNFTLISFLLAVLAAYPSFGQTVLKQVVIANGGQFGLSSDNANLHLYDPATGSSLTVDTVQTQSVQDLLIDGPFAYLAAQDSVVKYDLRSGERVAEVAFGAPSTITLALYEDRLLVGNWYAPFGFVGPYRNHFRIFDRETLAFVDSVAGLSQPAKSFVVLDDTAYIAQNYTSSAFSDSAGWLVRYSLLNGTLDSVSVNQNGEDLGKLMVIDGKVYGLNSVSNTVTVYDPATGQASTATANADLTLASRGSQFAFDKLGNLHTLVDGKIAIYDPVGRNIVQPAIVDTVVTAFAYDTLAQQYFISQTDFFSYTAGGIYNAVGQKVGTFPVGSSPEAIALAYNWLPEAQTDSATLMNQPMAQTLKVLPFANDLDPDATAFTGEILTAPVLGSASFSGDTLIYETAAGLVGIDSLQYAIIDDWGDQDSAWVYISITPGTNLDVATNAPSVRVYPNPSFGHLHLTLDRRWTGELTLHNWQGQILWRRYMDADQVELSLPALPAGRYLLRGTGATQPWQTTIVLR